MIIPADQFNYRNYTTTSGELVYRDFILKNGGMDEIANTNIDVSFILCDDYPVVVNPNKQSVYYHYSPSSGAILQKEALLQKFHKEIENTYETGGDFLVFADSELVGTDKVLYEKHWFKHPTTLSGKVFTFIYLLVAYSGKNLIKYYLHPLRTDEGGKFLNKYTGSFFDSSIAYEEFGLNIVHNILKLTFNNQHMKLEDFMEAFKKFNTRDLSKYETETFLNERRKK